MMSTAGDSNMLWPLMGGLSLFGRAPSTEGAFALFDPSVAAIWSPPTPPPDNGAHSVFSRQVFSRKVFVGGLPPDISGDCIVFEFAKYGELTVDWPHKSDSNYQFPPKGYAFLMFNEEAAVRSLLKNCVWDDGNCFTSVSSTSVPNKQVQVRVWKLADAEFVAATTTPADTAEPRRTVFVGGVPRPLTAGALARHLTRMFGAVTHAFVDTDGDTHYPKGSGRVTFASKDSFVAAVAARFVNMRCDGQERRVELKPYVQPERTCDLCLGWSSRGRPAEFFCGHLVCLRYLCASCWPQWHDTEPLRLHKPLGKGMQLGQRNRQILNSFN